MSGGVCTEGVSVQGVSVWGCLPRRSAPAFPLHAGIHTLPLWTEFFIFPQPALRPLIMHLLLAATKLGQGNVFTGICDSVHRGCLPQCMLGCHPLTPHPQEQTPRWEQTPPRSTPPPEQTPNCDQTLPREQTPPWEADTPWEETHPLEWMPPRAPP